MTSEERDEAERLADIYLENIPKDQFTSIQEDFIAGYAAGRESRQEQVSYLQREYAGAVSDWDKSQILLRAERARSRKLLEAIDIWYRIGFHPQMAKELMDSYEATRDR